MATVDIIIKGIAICYQKEVKGERVWRVLFPFNDCHSVKLSYEKGDVKGFIGHLGKARSQIEVVVAGRTTGAADSTNEFDEKVLDLTADTPEIRTHSKIASKPGWEERGVLLTIPSINFDVRRTLLSFHETKVVDEIFLYNPDGQTKQLLADLVNNKIVRDLAHSITGEIQLPEGAALSVKTDTDTVFTAEPDADYTLIFDNDCKDVTKLPDGSYKNDMEMIYELLVDPERPNRKFLVEATGNIIVEPPALLEGKPCLVVKVNDPDDLP